MIDQILTLVSTPPSSLVYHFLVLFSVEAALAMAFGQWMRIRDQDTGRLTIGLLVVGVARLAVVVVALLSWQGVVASNLVLPPIERAVDTLTALALMWAFVTMDDPIHLSRNTAADVLGGTGFVAVLGASAYSAYRWFQFAAPGTLYNQLFQDFAWAAAQVFILVVGLLWMLFRVRYVYDAFLKAIILLVFAGGSALHLVQFMPGDVAGATRAGLAIVLPMLAAVTYRHIVNKLLTFDAFDPSESMGLPDPESFADTVAARAESGETGAIVAPRPEPLFTPLLPPEMDVAEAEIEIELDEPDLIDTLEGKPVIEELATTPPTPKPPIKLDEEDEDGIGEEEELSAEQLRKYPNAAHVVEALEGLVKSLDVRDAATHIARAVAIALRADVAAIISVEDDQHMGVVIAGYDNITQAPLLEGATLPLDEQPTIVNALGRLTQRRLVPQRNMRELRNFFKALDIIHTGPAYVQPLHADHYRLGVLVIGSPYAKVAMSNPERTLLDRLGPLVTRALINATSYHEIRQKLDQMSGQSRQQIEAAQARADNVMAEAEDARKQAGQMKDYIADLEHQLAVAQEQLNEAQHSMQRTVQESQRESNDERVYVLERELEDTRTATRVELAALRARLTTAAITEQEVAFLQEQLMGKARQAIMLQTRLTEAQIDSEALQRQLENAYEGKKDEMERLNAKIKEMEAERKEIETELAETRENASSEVASLQEQTRLLKEDSEALKDLKVQLSERSSLVESLQAQLADKNKALTEATARMKTLDESMKSLEQQWSAKNDEIASLQESLQDAQQQASENLAGLEGGELDEAQLAQREAAIARLEAELASKTTAIERLEDELQNAHVMLSAFEGQLSEASAAMNQAVSQSGQVDSHDEVIASIAQELRSPMSSIIGYTDHLLGESVGLLGAIQRKFLQRVKGNAENMATLVDNLISITALDSGQFRLEPGAVDVGKVVEETITSALSQFQNKNLTLRMDIQPGLPNITADRDAITQITTHLLTNAALATSIDGEVQLNVYQATGSVSGANGNDVETDCIYISVSDAGAGISPEDQQSVFARQYRADNALIEGLGDTGVALSLAATLVEAHGGRIWLQSEQGVGTTFHVVLPVKPVDN